MMLQVNWRPVPRQLRTFGLIGLCVFASLGGLIHFRHRFLGQTLSASSAATAAICLWAVAAFSLVAALVKPRVLLPLYLGLTIVALPIGLVVSQGMMLFVYYLVVTPTGFFLRKSGWDPMARRFDRRASSYWLTRSRAKDGAEYLRQY